MTSKSTTLKILDVISVLLLAAAAYLALIYAPEEVSMGQVQRVFYFHVATAWVGMLGFIAAAIAGVTYLITKNDQWDIVEVAAVEISLVFFLITIMLGSIWARPIWNTWWTWDPRLTTAAVTELIYIAYFMLRGGIENPDLRARISAGYTILGGVSVPITFMVIRLVRTIHPVVIGSGDPNAQTFAMTGKMEVAFFFALFTFTVIFVDLFWHRIHMGNLAVKVEQLKLNVLH
ncbi:MAG: cytochrome c biogenesis protein CcsA [Chloroflexi bacterium]|nr:cytochrome c biogenesis protein CcsA [Chloroflexota bacterium]